MNSRKVRTIYFKELTDVLRDKRALFATFLLPLVLYPVLMLTMGQLGKSQVDKLRSSTYKVGIQNANAAPGLVSQLGRVDQFVIRRDITDLRQALLDGAIQIAIILSKPSAAPSEARPPNVRVALLADLSNERSKFAKDRVEREINEYKETQLIERLQVEGLGKDFLHPIELSVQNVASPEKMGGSMLGRFLPYLLVILLLTSAMYPAIDLTAGEKERKTIETLLITPASRLEVVAGKFLAVLTMAFVGSVVNLSSMGLTLSRLPISTATQRMHFDFSFHLVFIVLIVMIPLAALFSALAMCISIYAKSFREAQTYMTPLMFVVLFPAIASQLPGVELSAAFALIPILNVALLARQLAAGLYPVREILLVFISTGFFAILAIRLAVKIFEREDVVLRTSSDVELTLRGILFPRIRERTPDVGQVFFLFLLVLALRFYLGAWLQGRDLRAGVAISQVGLLLLPVILWVRGAGLSLRKTFNLYPAVPSAILLAVMLGISGGFVNTGILWIQSQFVSVPEADLRAWEKVASIINENLIYSTAIFALLPGICEELVFRGFVLKGLVGTYGKWLGLLTTGLMFGLFHLEYYRILPTAIFGILLSYLVVVTGSIFPAIITHCLYNFTILYIPRIPLMASRLEQKLPPPWEAMAAAVLILGCSVYLLFRMGARNHAEAPRSVQTTDPDNRPETLG